MAAESPNDTSTAINSVAAKASVILKQGHVLSLEIDAEAPTVPRARASPGESRTQPV
jgi:hypothetical protein